MLAVGAFLTASAADFGTTTLKVGSKGEAVKAVQTLVGATADGSFGPMTKAKVQVWQAANGLVADGVFGPASKAKANATVTTTTTTTTTTTAGCPAGALFNSMTGASCATTTTTVSTTGAAGDINVTSTSTDVESQVVEGAVATKVLGFKVEASGSDVSMTNLKVSLKNLGTTTASYRLSNVASEVAVWMGSTKVGSALVSDFTKDSVTYTKSIALTGATVKMGSANKGTFYVTVSALPNIDTNDMNGDNWAVLVNNFRYVDGTGAIMTSTETEGSISTGAFEFADLATSGDVKVTVSKDGTSPIEQNVTVSTTGSTKDLPLLTFKVKGTGSPVSFDTLNVTTTLSTTGAADTYTKIVGDIKLLSSTGTELASIDGSALSNGSNTFTLDDTYTIAKDTTATFKVVATINDGDNFTSGAGLIASFASFSPEDSNGGVVADTGTATGSKQTFVYKVPTVALTGTPALALLTHTDGSGAGNEDSYKATIDFVVTAPEDSNIYVPLDSFGYGTLGTAGVEYSKTGAAVVTSAVMQYTGTDNLTSITESNSYRVDASTSQKFTLTVYLTGNDANGKISMTGLWYATTNSVPVIGTKVSGLTNLYTPLVFLAK